MAWCLWLSDSLQRGLRWEKKVSHSRGSRREERCSRLSCVVEIRYRMTAECPQVSPHSQNTETDVNDVPVTPGPWSFQAKTDPEPGLE